MYHISDTPLYSQIQLSIQASVRHLKHVIGNCVSDLYCITLGLSQKVHHFFTSFFILRQLLEESQNKWDRFRIISQPVNTYMSIDKITVKLRTRRAQRASFHNMIRNMSSPFQKNDQQTLLAFLSTKSPTSWGNT